MNKNKTVLFFLYISIKIIAGCSYPSLFTSNGIYYSMPCGYNRYTEVSGADTFFITVQKTNCGQNNAGNIRLYYNSVKIDSFKNVFKTPAKIGHYRITYGYAHQNETWEFDLKLKPIEASLPYPIKITELQELNTEFVLYPNPAVNSITFLNEIEAIKKITILNLSGQILNVFDVNDTKLEVPLENYPRGLYFVSVCTLSEKIIIKKFTVL